MTTQPGFAARYCPAQRLTIVGNAERALSTIESELIADGWHEYSRPVSSGVIYELGSASRTFWLGALLPADASPRARRTTERALAAVHADQHGTAVTIDVALIWSDTGSVIPRLQNEFRAMIDRAIARFHAAGVLHSVGPVVAASTLPQDNFCFPAHHTAHLRADRRRDLSL